MRQLLAISRLIDGFSELLGKLATVLTFLACMISAGNAFSRYLFGFTSNALIEGQWYLFSAIFLLAAGYTLLHNGHVRIDVVVAQFSPRGRAWIDLLGALGGDGIMPSGEEFLMIGAAGLLALLGHAAVLSAVRQSHLSSIAPLYYVQTIWAGLAGLIVFGEVPGLAAIAGIALVVGAGLYTLRRQRVRHQVETPPPVVA